MCRLNEPKLICHIRRRWSWSEVAPLVFVRRTSSPEVGRQVLLLERGSLCSGSSHGNAAFIAPSRSLPLGAPGVIGKSLRWMLEPHGAFRLRPRLDPELARWLWAFRSSCHEAAAHHSALVIRDLTRESLEMYEAYAATFDFGFRRAGLLELFRTPDGRRPPRPSRAASRRSMSSQHFSPPARFVSA